MTLNPGELIHNRYQIEGIIGKGGMGAVYFGEDTVLSVRVAIKENLNPLPQAVRQFKREALLLASLRHPNLPRVTDHFIVGDMQYLIMDYVPGDDLKTILENEGALAEERVLGYAREIVQALEYLHTQHPPVVHRDVKPANIKITPEGRPVLVDFGIAKTAEVGGVTTTGARSLTPGFAPPEQYGSSPTDSRSDQYSLAATLYNLLTGTIPPDSLERTLGQASLRRLRELNPRISLAVDRTLWKAMSLSPSDRFGTIGDFLAALEGHLDVVEPVTVSTEPLTQVRRVPEQPTQENLPAADIPVSPARRALPWALLGGAAGLICLISAAVLISGFRPGGWALPAANLTPTLSAERGLPAVKSKTPGAAALPGNPSATPDSPPTMTLTPTRKPTETPALVGGSRLLAFVSNRSESKRFQVYTLDLQTGTVTQITTDPTDKGRIAWSSDGQRIYYEGKGTGGKWDIFRINLDGTDIRNLTNHPADDLYPAVSLHENKLAFESTRIEGYKHIYLLSPDEVGVTDISAQHDQKPFNKPNEWNPAWSPDERYLYFVLSVVGPVRIYRWDVKTPDSDPLMVTMFDGEYWEAEPAISPQGNLLAYLRQYDDNTADICVSETDLLKRRTCDNPIVDRTWNANPAWSPDGLLLAFASRRSGDSEIYTVTVSGAGMTNITKWKTAEDRYPAWQPAIPNPKETP